MGDSHLEGLESETRHSRAAGLAETAELPNGIPQVDVEEPAAADQPLEVDCW